MKKITDLEAKKIPVDVVEIINGVTTVVGLATPLLSDLFNKLNDFIASLGKNNPNSPKNVRLRLAALEAKDTLQKEVNKRLSERLAVLEAKLGIV